MEAAKLLFTLQDGSGLRGSSNTMGDEADSRQP